MKTKPNPQTRLAEIFSTKVGVLIKTQRQTERMYPLIFLSIAALLLLEIPIKSAIILVYVLTVIAGTGQKIATKAFRSGDFVFLVFT